MTVHSVGSPTDTGRVRILLAPTLATLLMAAFLIGLGIWQIQRLAWKEGLIREIDEAAFLHLDDAAPFSIDQDASSVPGELPQGGETVLDIPNNHLSYAFTWFGLAAGLLGVYAVFAWRRLRIGG